MALTLLALGERDAPARWLDAAATQSLGPFGETCEMREPERNYQTAPWFTTAAGACIEAAMRMFVYDEDGVTYLLRGVPDKWKDASVCTSAAGGFRVRLDLESGRLTVLEMEAMRPRAGKSIRLRGRKGLFDDVLRGGNPPSATLEKGVDSDDLVVVADRPGVFSFRASPAAEADNLIVNGSFELGASTVALGRKMSFERNAKREFTPLEVVSGGAAVGSRALKVRDPLREGSLLYFNDFRLDPGKDYTLSFSARSDAAGCSLSFHVTSWDFKTEADRKKFRPDRICDSHSYSVKPSAEWKRHSFAFRVPDGWGNRDFGMSARIRQPASGDSAGASVYLDGVQLVEGKSGEFSEPGRIEAVVSLPEGRILLKDGETKDVRLSVGLHNASRAAAHGKFDVVGRDNSLRKERFRKTLTYSLKAGSVEAISLDVPVSTYGALGFDLEFPPSVPSRTSGGTLCVLGVSEQPEPDPEKDYCVGLNVGPAFLTKAGWLPDDPEVGIACAGSDPHERIRAYRDIGCRVVRVSGGARPYSWRTVEPAEGAFDFTLADYAVDSYVRNGLQVQLCLAEGDFGREKEGWPEWIARQCRVLDGQGWSGTSHTYLPPCERWTNYVQRIVSHFAGRVRHWEFCNEPNDIFRPYSLYVDWLKATDAALKSANPAARTVGFCATGDLGNDPQAFLSECFRAGGLRYCDVVSFHPYNAQMLATPSRSTRTRADDQIAAVVGNMSASGRVLPLWNDECFYVSARLGPSINRDRHEPHHVAWRCLTDLACGVKLSCFLREHQVWSDPVAPRAEYWQNFRGWALNADAVALNMVARTLQGAEPVSKRELGNDCVLCVYRMRNGGYAAAAWHYGVEAGTLAPTRDSLAAELPAGVRVTDMYGNELDCAAKHELGWNPLYVFGTLQDFDKITITNNKGTAK